MADIPGSWGRFLARYIAEGAADRADHAIDMLPRRASSGTGGEGKKRKQNDRNQFHCCESELKNPA